MTSGDKRYTALYCDHRGATARELAAADVSGALDELTDDLSIIAAEGRALPRHVDVFERDGGAEDAEPLLIGTLQPRKG